MSPSSRAFVSNHVFTRQNINLLVSETSGVALGPGLDKFHAVDGSQNIDPYRRNADLENQARTRQVAFSQIVQGRTERLNGFNYALCVWSIGPNPHVEIFGRANIAVRRESMGADEQKLNSANVEFC